MRVLTIAAIVAANAVGVAVVTCFAVWALPKPPGVADSSVIGTNLAVGGVYLALALIVGVLVGRRLVEGGPEGIRAWFEEDRVPTTAQRVRALRGPLRIMALQAVLWGLAVVCFAVLNATFSGLLVLGVGATVAIGGLTTSAAAYILAELALRPVASRALAAGTVDRRGIPGVAARWLLAWALGTGAPIVGLAMVGIVALTDVPIDETTLALTTVVLSAIALVFGALVSILAAYATVHPISSIRRGLERVRRGDFEVELAVWDSTEMGLLQSGFNEMAAGLRERERIRDLFGRQVGHEAAGEALATADDPKLGGKVCEVAVLFVDLIGSTALAADRRPEEVVGLLNAFFAEVVEVVESHGGWINKFQGDAALAIFGVPAPLEDRNRSALCAARELDARLRRRVPDVTAGIGVASGRAVAGYVGAESRFEYTVVGDPVNEAARLTDLAKQHPARVLASQATVSAARGDEPRRWKLGGTVTLRGRAEETRLAHPLPAEAPALR